jgi:hypothetical protein
MIFLRSFLENLGGVSGMKLDKKNPVYSHFRLCQVGLRASVPGSVDTPVQGWPLEGHAVWEGFATC